MKKFLITSLFALLAFAGYSQSVRDVVINEILVNNVNNFEDDYGHRVSWIELFNTGFSKVNVASCYLVIESGNESISYRIPKGDSRTEISPQGYIVFFCEGTATKGTFHTNFTLSMESNTDGKTVLADDLSLPVADKQIKLSFLEANGRDTVSSVIYNLADQKPDIAMGRLMASDGTYEFTELATTTPRATNETHEPVPAHELFRRTDPYGYGMAITAMSVVLTALLLLYLVFRTIGKVMIRMADRKKGVQSENAASPAPKQAAKEVFSGDDMAAIALALHLYDNDLHDKESAVLTINRVAKVYSPWSSKLYGLTQEPARAPRKK